MIHLWSFYGLLGAPRGPGRWLSCGFSAGVDVLADKIKARFPKVVRYPTLDWTDWRSVVGDVGTISRPDKIVLLGHSFGAGSCTFIANALNDIPHDVDAILSFDASICPPGNPMPLEGNVKAALSIQGLGPSLPGHAALCISEDAKRKPRIQYQTTFDLHERIDDDTDLHEVALKFLARELEA